MLMVDVNIIAPRTPSAPLPLAHGDCAARAADEAFLRAGAGSFQPTLFTARRERWLLRPPASPPAPIRRSPRSAGRCCCCLDERDFCLRLSLVRVTPSDPNARLTHQLYPRRATYGKAGSRASVHRPHTMTGSTESAMTPKTSQSWRFAFARVARFFCLRPPLRPASAAQSSNAQTSTNSRCDAISLSGTIVFQG